MIRAALLLALLALAGCCGPLLCGTCSYADFKCCMTCVEWPGSKPCARGAEVGGYHGGAWHDGKGNAVEGKHHADVCACPPKCGCWSGKFHGVNEPGRARWANRVPGE